LMRRISSVYKLALWSLDAFVEVLAPCGHLLVIHVLGPHQALARYYS
jgi:hypothetical protein